MKLWTSLVVSALVVVAGGMAAPPVAATEASGPALDESTLPFEPIDGASVSWGVIDGAGYRIEVPADWNGMLAVSAPGFVGGGMPVIGDIPGRAHLIERGFAWASTSYRTAAYNTESGALDVKNLVDVFTASVGAPSEVYAVGLSMGGHVVKHLVEQWPSLTSGALTMCAGDVSLFDYFQDVHLMGETLAGRTPAVPSAPDYAVTGLPAVQRAFGPAFPDQLNDVGKTFKESVEMLSGGERPIFDQGWSGPLSFSGITVAQSLGGAGNGLDNTATVYQLDNDPALSAAENELNESIVRVEGVPPKRTEAGWRPVESQVAVDLTGRIDVPVLALHTLGDLFVPFSMEQIYARKVAAQGASDNFVVRAIREPNHCIFTAEETNRAFDDLITWAGTGVRPRGDEVLDPAVVADPIYGCRYTEGFSFTRIGLPACPTAWDPKVVYSGGDEVALDGDVYVAQWWTSGERPGSTMTGSWMQRGAPVGDAGYGVRDWTASWVYSGGETVAHAGHLYQAKWWTRNQAPGDPYGPWRDLGRY